MSSVISMPARMTSSRFPGKVLADLGNGSTVLGFLIDRLSTAMPVCVVTGSDPSDDPIVEEAEAHGAQVVRGTHGDMIAQHWRVAQATEADLFFMAGADDPLLDPEMFRLLEAAMFRLNETGIEHENPYLTCDYARTAGWPLGLNVWGWSRYAIREAHPYAWAPEERQHVIPYWERRPHLYGSVTLSHTPDLYDAFRVTVDDGPDLQLVRTIISALPQGFGAEDVIDLMARHPELNALNPNGLRGYAARDALYDITSIEQETPFRVTGESHILSATS